MRLRLLERVRMIDRDPDNAPGADLRALMDSIRDHLVEILNSRRGCSESAPDFGLPDFVVIGGGDGPDGIRDLERELRDLVAKYEPRLRGVEVQRMGDEPVCGRLMFSLSGTLELDGGQSRAVFATHVGGDGRIHVSG